MPVLNVEGSVRRARRRSVGLWVAVAVAASAGPLAAQQGPPPVFRGVTDSVTVDVSVRLNSNQIGGLAAKDFRLTDNGVPQAITSVDTAVVPIDLTILIDVSDDLARFTDELGQHAAEIISKLRAIDRAEVWTTGTSVTEVVAPEDASLPVALPHLTRGGFGSVYDGLAAALMEPVRPGARHLIIALSNGIDTDSVLPITRLQAIAERADATALVSQPDVVQVANGWATGAEEERSHILNCFRPNCPPKGHFWVPHYTPPGGHTRFDPLTAVLVSTGGQLYRQGGFLGLGYANATDNFLSAFRDFQQNYVLRYTPQGVAREGWHAIGVTIPASPDDVVHARRGYAIEAEAPSRAIGGVAATPPSPPTPLESLVQAYGQGDYAGSFTAAHRFADPVAMVRGVRAGGDLWPTRPEREAVLALELSQAALFAQGAATEPLAKDWLTQESHFVQPRFGPDAFEHEWLLAAVDLLEGLVHPAAAEGMLSAALERFPGDSRLLLARAILADQRWPIGTEAVLSTRDASRQVADALAKYDAAMALPDVADEARVREAWLLHRVGRDPDALARLAAVRTAGLDRTVQFLRDLFQGKVLTSLGRLPEAIAAYRASLAVVPGAQSARVDLMNALLDSGDRDAALTLAESIRTSPGPDADPWYLYWQGDYRRFPDAIASLRQEVR